jgi:hypothetical protein
MRRVYLLTISLSLLVSLTACGSSELTAQEKRNNFDSCKIEFLAQVPQEKYLKTKTLFDKQADENCAQLLSLNGDEALNFKPKQPVIPTTAATASQITMKDVCKLVTAAAYAHNEFDTDAIGETIDYQVWYSRIQSYFKKAAAMLRKLPGDNSNLVSAAEQASLNASGVNTGLDSSEELLYSTCNISEEKVYENFEKWMG